MPVILTEKDLHEFKLKVIRAMTITFIAGVAIGICLGWLFL